MSETIINSNNNSIIEKNNRNIELNKDSVLNLIKEFLPKYFEKGAVFVTVPKNINCIIDKNQEKITITKFKCACLNIRNPDLQLHKKNICQLDKDIFFQFILSEDFIFPCINYAIENEIISLKEKNRLFSYFNPEDPRLDISKIHDYFYENLFIDETTSQMFINKEEIIGIISMIQYKSLKNEKERDSIYIHIIKDNIQLNDYFKDRDNNEIYCLNEDNKNNIINNSNL
jgi:hypothetical protein